MNNFPNQKVLIVGNAMSIHHLLTALAKEYTDIHFDIITSPEFKTDLPNVSIIPYQLEFTFKLDCTNFFSAESTEYGQISTFDNSHLTYIKDNHNSYDLIIAPCLEIQRNQKLAELRRTISTPFLTPEWEASLLEYDKIYTKTILRDAEIPTPAFEIIPNDHDIVGVVKNKECPVVFKLSKYFSRFGYGSWVFKTQESKHVLDKIVRVAESTDNTQQFYIEEFVEGKEASVHYLCNGREFLYLGSARDYKKIGEGDTGMNTGGLGAYSPVEYFTEEIKNTVDSYVGKLLSHLQKMNIIFRGFLYIGIIIDKTDTPIVLEINTRPGTPELITILNTIDKRNLLDNIYYAATGNPFVKIDYKSVSSVAVILRHKKYNIKLKWDTIFPDISDIPADLEFINSSPILQCFNYFGALVSTKATKIQCANKIYSYLQNKDLGDYTMRKDIGLLE